MSGKRRKEIKIKRQEIRSPARTLYVWDLANTLFQEIWNQKDTGFPDYDTWVAAQLRRPLNQISPREYEENYRVPLSAGWHFNLTISPGFRETLAWTKNNETFSTGTREQIAWRAQYLNPKYGFDFRRYLRRINSTFDYVETNQKTTAMLAEYLRDRYRAGYETIVYADDKLSNLRAFQRAVRRAKKSCPRLRSRLYHILNSRRGLVRAQAGYTDVGTLFDLLKQEKYATQKSL